MTLTNTERELALKATTQMRLGNGLFMSDREFKSWFCAENNVSDQQLTRLVRQLLEEG